MHTYVHVHMYPVTPCTPSSLQGIINLILATDMSRHSEIVGDFETVVAEGFDFDKANHRRQVQVPID